jgi:hypothetical protein
MSHLAEAHPDIPAPGASQSPRKCCLLVVEACGQGWWLGLMAEAQRLEGWPGGGQGRSRPWTKHELSLPQPHSPVAYARRRTLLASRLLSAGRGWTAAGLTSHLTCLL